MHVPCNDPKREGRHDDNRKNEKARQDQERKNNPESDNSKGAGKK